ncbi:hypothetical protein GCM10020295_57510 [Streptomyces cinereospinus]
MFLLPAWDERDNAGNTLTSWEEKSTGNAPWELGTGAIAIAHAALGNLDAARHRASRLARCQRGASSAYTRWPATTATRLRPEYLGQIFLGVGRGIRCGQIRDPPPSWRDRMSASCHFAVRRSWGRIGDARIGTG